MQDDHVRKKKHRRGHWCWACNRVLSNERFSGRGHAKHTCSDCQKLPAAELAYRQAVRNLERCITSDGIIPRKRRRQFNSFLQHKDARVRQLAEQMVLEDRESRQLQRYLAGDYRDEPDDSGAFGRPEVVIHSANECITTLSDYLDP